MTTKTAKTTVARKVAKFDRPAIKAVHERLTEVLTREARALGLKMVKNSCTYSEVDFRLALAFCIDSQEAEEAAANRRHALDFEEWGVKYGTHVRSMRSMKEYIVIGVKPRSRKFILQDEAKGRFLSEPSNLLNLETGKALQSKYARSSAAPFATLKFDKAATVAMLLKMPQKAQVRLVHDQGVYLMCGGEVKEKGVSFTTVQAEGCNPDVDADWRGTASDLVGGDDFGKNIGTVERVLAATQGGFIQVAGGNGPVRITFGEAVPEVKEVKDHA